MVIKMVSPLFLYYYFKDITKQIPLKYLLNIPLQDYEIFTINTFFYDDFYNFWLKKPSLNLFQGLKENLKSNINYFCDLIKASNYNKEGIILLYGYLSYLVINKETTDLTDLTNFYFLDQKINYHKELKKYNYSYYDLRKPYYIFLDRIARHIIGYPDIEGYLKKASRSCYQYYKFTNKFNPFKKILLGVLEKINHKKYLNNNHSYKDLKATYAALIDKSLALIEAVNKLLYFDKDKDLFDVIDTYLL